jgi:5-methylcytosine-specific restriction endonuclease McrA
MARKRMIKPEFWTDSTMVQLPAEARLLFIGMWNFADDYGYIDDEPDRLALQVLPADDVDVDMLLDLLIAAGRVERYRSREGMYFLYIPHFVDHQRVDHPAKPTYPDVATCTKASIPLAVRRQVALKYGCKPGESAEAACYYCGEPGSIYWPRTRKGQPSAWVAFSRLEIDHFVAESKGGPTESENLVLACRTCNRSKHASDGVEYVTASLAINHEDSREVAKSQQNSAQVKLDQDKLGEDGGGARTRVAAPSSPSLAVVPSNVEARLFAIFENPKQVKKLVAAAVASRGAFTISDVEVCEQWLSEQNFEKKVGTLNNILEAGQLPKTAAASRKPRTQAEIDELNRKLKTNPGLFGSL